MAKAAEVLKLGLTLTRLSENVLQAYSSGELNGKADGR